MLIGAPCAVGMSVLAKPILRLLFEDAMAERAAPMLTVLAPSILFIAISNVSGALLQAMGKVKLPLISMSVGALIKLISAWILIGRYGIQGAPMSTFLCYFAIALLNLGMLANQEVKIRFHIFGVPLIAALACGATALLGYGMCSVRWDSLAVIVAAGMGGAVYGLLIVVMGGITRAEWRLIPGGRAICRRLEKWHILKREK